MTRLKSLRTVSNKLTIYKCCTEYDVSAVPYIKPGDRVMVEILLCGKDKGNARLVYDNGKGNEIYFPIKSIERNEFGFPVGATVIGKGIKHNDHS